MSKHISQDVRSAALDSIYDVRDLAQLCYFLVGHGFQRLSTVLRFSRSDAALGICLIGSFPSRYGAGAGFSGVCKLSITPTGGHCLEGSWIVMRTCE